jgi:hypothetical protein
MAGCFPSPALPGSGSTGLLHPQNSQPFGSPHKGKTTPKPPQRQVGEFPRTGMTNNDKWPLPPSIFFPVLVVDKNKLRLKAIFICTAIDCNYVALTRRVLFLRFARREDLHSNEIGGGNGRQHSSHNLLCRNS